MTAPRTISRRDLLSARFLANTWRRVVDDLNRDDAPRSPGVPHVPGRPRPPRPLPILRPPGAVDEADFMERCTRCMACVDACPHDAIVPAPPRMRHAVGTPMIDVATQPCRLCEDRPCAAVCEPDVIRMHAEAAMGSAMISNAECLAWSGTGCTVCSEHCPVENAIEIHGGRPVINTESCTGCGVCHYVCPAPRNAVIVMPRRPTENLS